MRKQFPSFYEDDDSNSSSFEHWDDAIFAFDASALLMIFEYEPELQNNWLKELERLKGEGKLFLPYQVANEYHLQLRSRRKKVLSNAEEYFVKPIEEIISTLKKIHQDDRHPLSKEGILSDLVNDLVGRAETARDGAGISVEIWRRGYETNFQDCKSKLAEIFDSVVSPKPSASQISAYCQVAEARFTQNVPPGYKDRGKSNSDYGNQYGDAIAWFQILEFTKDRGENIVWITKDNKADWFDKGAPYSKPRQELLNEMLLESGCTFYIGTIRDFVKWFNRKDNSELGAKDLAEVDKLLEDSEVFMFSGLCKEVFAMPSAREAINELPEKALEELMDFLKQRSDDAKADGSGILTTSDNAVVYVTDRPGRITIEKVFADGESRVMFR